MREGLKHYRPVRTCKEVTGKVQARKAARILHQTCAVREAHLQILQARKRGSNWGWGYTFGEKFGYTPTPIGPGFYLAAPARPRR